MKTPKPASVERVEERHKIVNYINDDMRHFYSEEEAEAKEQADIYAEAAKEVGEIRNKETKRIHSEAVGKAQAEAEKKAEAYLAKRDKETDAKAAAAAQEDEVWAIVAELVTSRITIYKYFFFINDTPFN